MPTPRILLVEDDEIIASIIEAALADRGFDVVVVNNGQTAWTMLQAGVAGLVTILLDRELPEMNGMELLRALKTLPAYEQVPVVFETSADHPDSIREGIAEGAYYYLTKPFEPDLLLAIVNAAVAQYRDWQASRKALETAEQTLCFLENALFRIRSLADAHILAGSLARMHPILAKAGLGLLELLVNAIEHGNLGIDYQEKSRFILEERLHEELEQRFARPENQAKSVEVECERFPDAYRFTIRDQGAGFEWERYLDFDIERAFDPNGRGIAMARKISFDTLEYQGNGNTVVATVKL